ncbi:MAG: sugar ABC transporter permease [Clostridiales bacterium]|nr:sugar ABC transporter permease [Clostridiales bacterium]
MKDPIKKYFPLFVLPVFVCFCLCFVWPFIQGVCLSFCNFFIPKDATFTGVSNYVTVFRDTSFWHAFLITCLYAVASIICVNVPAFFIAYLLKEKFKGVTLFRASFFLPNLIGGVVLGYIWSMLFDGILSRFGTYLTASPVFGFWGLVILVAWQQIGYMMIIYIAGFTALPEEMLEASQMDGANRFQRMTKIIIPNMKASVAICTFLTLTNSFKMFDQNLALTGGQPIRTLENGMQLKTTELLAMNIYSTYQINNHWHGTAQAKAVIFFLLVAAFGALQLYVTREKKEKKPKKTAASKKPSETTSPAKENKA